MDELAKEALERIRRSFGVSMALEESRPGCVFPEVDVEQRRITFNPKLRSFLTLYNLMLQFPRLGGEAVALFRLYNLHLDSDAYPQAENALDALEAELGRMKRRLWWRSVKPVEQSVNLQMLFILLHEAAHAVFFHKPKARTEYIGKARTSVEECLGLYTDAVPDKMKDYTGTFIPEGLPEAMRQEAIKEIQEKFKQYGSAMFDFSCYLRPCDDGMLEEFACDRLAWQRALAQQMEVTGMGGTAVLQSNISLLLTLHILDYDKALRNVFKGSDDNEKINLIRNAGVRHAALRHCIWHFYKETYPADHSHDFLRLSEERDERTKRLLVCSMLSHAKDMNTLQGKSHRPFDEARIDALEKRFEKIEKKVFYNLK